MSTLSRYLLLRTGGRVLILLVIFLVLVAGGQVGSAIGRGVPLLAVLPALPSIILMALPIAIPLAVAAGILVSIGAMHRDGEFRALASSGLRSVDVVARLWPLLAVAILASGLLTHIIMPKAMYGLRSNQERYVQAALAHRVNAGRSFYSEANGSAFALQATGNALNHVFLTSQDETTVTALYARGAHWSMAKGELGDALALKLDDVRILRREADGTARLVTTPSMQYPYEKEASQRRRLDEPDTWSTATLISFIRDWQAPASLHDLNEARLALHLRLFIPISLVFFTIFAAGLGLRRAGQEPLMAVIIIMLVVTLSTSPAIFYVKNALDHELVSPAWLLWPQGLITCALGAWWLAHPDLANDRGGVNPLSSLLAQIGRRIGLLLRRRSHDEKPMLASASWPSVLMRLLGRQGISTWLLVLAMGTFLVLFGQIMSRIGRYVRAIGAQPLDMLEWIAVSLPEYVSLWLPLSVGAAALLVAAPLLQRGNLMVLCASGIPLRRVFAPLLAIAAVACLGKICIDDQLLPRFIPHADQLEEDLTRNQAKRQHRPAAGWTSGPAFWMTASADADAGSFRTVASFVGDVETCTGLLADELTWDAGTSTWMLSNVLVLNTGAPPVHHQRIAMNDLAWPPLQSREQLALDLLPDRTKTTDQLIHAASPLTLEIIVSRCLTALTPLFGLLLCLPSFVRFENRTRIAGALVRSSILLAAPVGIVALANRSILSGQGQPVLTAGIIACALLSVGIWRWWRMAP